VELGVEAGVEGVAGASLEEVAGVVAGVLSDLVSPEPGGVTEDVAFRLSFL
jgi:hypothetical protein